MKSLTEDKNILTLPCGAADAVCAHLISEKGNLNLPRKNIPLLPLLFLQK